MPGGDKNLQDIYPLTPLQEGILVHHLMMGEGDPYLLHALFAFDSRAPLDRFLAALQTVIDRHDVLRTAILWEGLREPMQAVWRKAALPTEEVSLAEDDPASALWRSSRMAKSTSGRPLRLASRSQRIRAKIAGCSCCFATIWQATT